MINLKSKISNLVDTYNFHTGNKRCTYVNQRNVSWKTTIFAHDKKEAMMILIRLCNLIEEMVDIRMFTSSEIRLANDKEANILVYLHKVRLLVNKKNIRFFFIMYKCIFFKKNTKKMYMSIVYYRSASEEDLDPNNNSSSSKFKNSNESKQVELSYIVENRIYKVGALEYDLEAPREINKKLLT